METGLKCILEILGLRPSKFHNKNNTEGGDEHCEAMHFKSFDLTFRMLQHEFSKASAIFFISIYSFTCLPQINVVAQFNCRMEERPFIALCAPRERSKILRIKG